MSALRAREELLSRVKQLTDEQVTALLALIKVMQSAHPTLPYHEADDPILNGELLFSGSPDLAERSEDILWAELGKRREDDNS